MSAFHIVIPARYGSVRLPGKPLRMLAGDLLVAHVYARAAESGAVDVMIATDDERVLSACDERGLNAMLTSTDHASGTDRCAEVATRCGWSDDEIVVNVQGDEPLLPPRYIQQVASALHDSGAALATLACPIESAGDFANANVVKVVLRGDGRALLFSRAPVPCRRDAQAGTDPVWHGALRHIGLYAYRVDTLHTLSSLPPCALEETEKLEQLRALWHGLSIQVALAPKLPGPGVDTPEDLVAVERLLLASRGGGEL